ncbi:MAG: ROK family transcriptional regulator [Actinobacteria bacterium]|nr:ROK family transcriptional regulator [Cyanobacteriota bacterium]MCL5772051.1 ROK family transcriptional regulator [Actinomycetota bacterium]
MRQSFKFVKTASSELQFKINQSIIFNYIRENAPISRAKISKDLKISAPAVSRVIEKLIENNYVFETEKIETKSGKRPTLIALNEDRGFVLGIDLGGERIRMSLMNYSGKIVKKYIGPEINDNINIEQNLEIEIQKIFEDCKKNEWNYSNPLEVQSICIAIPADVDAVTGKITGAPLYGSWKNINLKESISSIFKVPVFIENNVNLAAWGEKNFGRGKGYTNEVFLEISNGVAAGIIIDNVLLRGENGYAGEIGFTIINTENLGFKVKNKGFLEKFASVTSIRNKALRAVSDGEKTLILDLAGNDINKINSSLVCEAAIKGDKLAKEIIENVVKFLSIAMINLILIIDPKIIILGGYIFNLPYKNELFVNPIKNFIKQSIPFEIPDIEFSVLGDDAALLGSCFMAIESLLTGEFPYRIDKN